MSHPMSRRRFLAGSAATLAAVALAPSATAAPPHPLAKSAASDVALSWVRETFLTVRQERLSPPAAARIYAHLGIALHEAVVDGAPNHRSLGGQLNGLGALPTTDRRARHDWPSAANAAAARVLAHDFAGRPDALARIEQQASRVGDERSSAGITTDVIARSLTHGRAIGDALISWIDTDGWSGIQGRPFTPPTGAGLWVPTPPNFGSSIEPHWREVRFLALDESDPCRPPAHVPFSTEHGSPFWHQANATYQAGTNLTDDQRATALYWRDNPDGTTGLPSGHWMLIATQAISDRGLDLAQAAEVLATCSIAVADAFSSCWREKYRTNVLRPVTYIRQWIDPSWNSWVNSPAFPEYTSGHSVGSAAAARVLTALLGTQPFVDTAVELTGHAPRRFASFDEAAREAAASRLYGGIHYPMGIEAGLTQGACVADGVLGRLRTRRGS